ncbi:MAG: amidohydrolase family protein [Gemmatimonadaceae bacterium]|nr:amidohydrolase family protein [Gemmatimonadaceae bacterium]
MRTTFMQSARIACVSLACASATTLSAQTIAITGGTVYPAVGPRIDNGTVIVRDGKIVAVGANLAVPTGATRVDATGKWVTPGLVNAFTTLGLSESGGPQFSGGYNDTQAQVTDGISASFEAADGVNPASTMFRPSTSDGITTVGVWPSGNWVSGRGAVMDLTGNTVSQMVVKRGVGMLLNFDAGAANAGARAAMFGRLRELLVDVKQYALRKAEYEGNRTRAFAAKSSQLEALLPVARGTMPLFVVAERASDIRAAVGIAKEFALRLVIVGGAEAWMVAGELATAKVPVMVGALNNIPETFDALGQRQENASLLRAAGVAVTLIGNGPGDPLSFNVRNVRQEAGNAVAYGMSWDDALRAITAAPAEALGVADRVGALAVGREANIVVWDGDPFEFTTRATHVYIRGVLQTGLSREDELTARYRKLPPG